MAVLGGVRPPLAALPVLLALVAGLTVFAVGSDAERGVPEAVLSSQQHIAEDGAVALQGAVDQSVTDLRAAAADFGGPGSVPADAMLTRLDRTYRKWRGTAVVDLSTGGLLASHGEAVPLGKVDLRGLPANPPPRLVRDDSGVTRLLAFATLTQGDRQELLVASQSLKLPGISVGRNHTLDVVDRDGATLASAGPGSGTDRAKALAGAAAREAQSKGPSDTATAGGFAGPSGSLVGAADGKTRTAVGYAAVARAPASKESPSSALGLTVVTTVRTERHGAGTGDLRLAILAAAVLLILAAGVTAALHVVVQRPVLRLRREAQRLGSGDLTAPVHVSRFGEPGRVGAALEALRLQLRGRGEPSQDTVAQPPARRRVLGTGKGRRRLGLRTVLVVCAFALLAWPASMLLTLGSTWPHPAAVVPRVISDDQRQRTETTADRVRRGINDGYADLAHLAIVIDASRSEEARKILDRSLEQHGRYQSLYVVDGAGEILVRAGGEPRTPKKVRIRPGVMQTNTSGTEPVLAAVAAQQVKGAPTRSGRRYVVGEFKVQYLAGILNRPGLGSVWLVDSAHRVIASNRGFVAFGRVSDGRLRAQLKSVRKTKGSAELLLGWRDPAVAAVAPFNDKRGVASALGWSVASIRPVFWIGLPEYEAQRRIMLVGLLGVTTGALCLGWLYLVVVRPLREVTEGAEALAAGDRRTVLYPRYHDEVGSLARSLELIRQRLPRADASPAPGSPDGPPTASTSLSGPGPRS
ncbi:HAMP domain-containing protein [Streptomyces sp. ME18-1-4]|uniref:HAMP domain-containing protein n=1 Tax=Streptomyces sp. ME18-1-4 TaxID=3028685 RepID=UPI0029A40675|nr:HAMP domain-containing protein [Streptomyces sp. ME18-1-4]MDX3241161.1 HAMP domain-containing protein [Streptomyces sp. ME18-1-4]